MLSKTEENRGGTLKLRSEKEENIGTTQKNGFDRGKSCFNTGNRIQKKGTPGTTLK